MKNHLTFDVEEAFQSHNFKETIRPQEWKSMPARVVENTKRILDILAGAKCRATFFVVGWVANRYPELVQLIDSTGHEVAAHSYSHRAVYEMSQDEFREDLRRNVEALRSVTGKPVLGYRAPSYTITRSTLWALHILFECGFTYDSSIYPVRFHPRYGFPGSPLSPYRHHSGLIEFPLPVTRIFGKLVPIATGFYLRLMPYRVTRHLMNKNNRKGMPVVVNIHPWEIDPDQPILPIRRSLKWRHYYGLKQTQMKLIRLLTDFSFEPLGVATKSLSIKVA